MGADFVVSLYLSPPHTIHPPHVGSPICNCILEAPDAFQQHSQLTAWYCSKLTSIQLSVPQDILSNYSTVDRMVVKMAEG